MKKITLARKFTRRANRLFILTISIVVTMLLASYLKDTLYYSTEIGNNALKRGASTVEKLFKDYLLITEELSMKIEHDIALNHNISREDMVLLLQKELEAHKYVIGVGIVFEPNAYDGKDEQYVNKPYHDETGRFIPYVTGASCVAVVGYQTSEFYQKPKKLNSQYITNPYTYNVEGEDVMMTTIVSPIRDSENNFLGVVAFDIDIKRVDGVIDDFVTYDGAGSMAIIDSKGFYMAHTHKKNLIGKFLGEDTIEPEKRLESIVKGQPEHWFNLPLGCMGHPIHLTDNQTPWQLQTKVHAFKVFESFIYTLIVILIAIILAIIATTIRLRFFVRKMTKPLERLTVISEDISKGDLGVDINIDTNDEIGKLATAFKHMVDNLTEHMNEVKNGAENISSACRQLQGSSENLSSATNEQASVTEQISCNMQEMNATLQQTNEKGVVIKNETTDINDKMVTLREGAKEATELQIMIADKVAQIDEIAMQVRILSLNAAVEAARAGDYGKGFAVVAAEIQKLSDNTAIISKSINDLANQSKDRSLDASLIVNDIAEALTNLKRNVVDISNNTDEQAQGVAQVTNGTNHLTQGIQNVAANSEELASTVEELNNQSEILFELTKSYKF